MTGGFRVGDQVLTPSMRTAQVTAVARRAGREWVTVLYDEQFRGSKEFPANSLQLLVRP